MERQTNETVKVELGGEEIHDEVQIDNEQYVRWVKVCTYIEDMIEDLRSCFEVWKFKELCI